MSDFTELNWKNALTDLYQKSIEDADFRDLCLSDPRAAIAEVSDIEVPPELKLQFVDDRAEFVYFFLLPPVPAASAPSEQKVRDMIRWATICTDPTTTFTGPI